ncbi:MAG TPA: DUF3618 domain-containing protein [Gemmataceae bacterium]|nr:DUF3618 domain-containing protein [Gemmataceae bacterium]
MDQEPDLKNLRPDELRRQIDATRDDLTRKVEALEQKVMDTVGDARNAVLDTVAAVKSTVRDTVDSFKQAMDLRRQVRNHPWAALAGAVAAGYVLGRLLSQRAPERTWPGQRAPEFLPSHSKLQPLAILPLDNGAAPSAAPVAEVETHKPNLLRELAEKFAPEVEQLKAIAIGSLMAVARESINQSIAPPLGPELAKIVDSITPKLGGIPLHEHSDDLARERQECVG